MAEVVVGAATAVVVGGWGIARHRSNSSNSSNSNSSNNGALRVGKSKVPVGTRVVIKRALRVGELGFGKSARSIQGAAGGCNAH